MVPVVGVLDRRDRVLMPKDVPEVLVKMLDRPPALDLELDRNTNPHSCRNHD